MAMILARGVGPLPHAYVTPPIARGLQGWFTFDAGSGSFGRNRARGKSNAQIVGAPVAYASHGRFKGGQNYLITDIGDSDEITIMVVGRAVVLPTDPADGVFLVGGYQGTSQTPGITGSAGSGNLYMTDPARLSASAARNNGSGSAGASSVSVTGTLPNNWAIRAMRAKTGDFTKVFDLTAGVSSVGTSVLQRALSNTKIRIGGATVDFTGESEISVVGIWHAYHSDDEIEQNAALMRSRMQRFGIPV